MVDSGTQFHPRRRFFKTCSNLPAPRSFGKRNSEAAIRCWQQPVNHGEAPGGHIVRPALHCFDPAFPRNERPIPYDEHWEITMPPINTSKPTMTFFRILTAPRCTGGLAANLLRHRQAHVARVVEDAAAIRAGDDLLIALAGNHHLALQLHVAAAADSVRDADHYIFAFAFAEAFIARQD